MQVLPYHSFNNQGVTDLRGSIVDHISEEFLPLYIRLSTNEVYKLRKYSSILRIHSSGKKEGEEEFFAELQLFTPWRSDELETWEQPEIKHQKLKPWQPIYTKKSNA